jgi:hypothetical protein
MTTIREIRMVDVHAVESRYPDGKAVQGYAVKVGGRVVKRFRARTRIDAGAALDIATSYAEKLESAIEKLLEDMK